MEDINIAKEEKEEEEEALSLRDFPLVFDTRNNPQNDHFVKTPRRSSSESAPEFFEFLSDLSYDMCPADDIIFCGKLIPLNQQQSISFQTPKHHCFQQNRKSIGLRKRSDSLSELCSDSVIRSKSTKEHATLLRNSRSLDYKNLRSYDMERNSSTRSMGKSENSVKKTIKRRWYVFMFGMVTFPPEMELKEIKSRQFRVNAPSTMLRTVEDGGKNITGNRSSGKGSSWNLLKALSCRDHSSVAVATSLWMPEA